MKQMKSLTTVSREMAESSTPKVTPVVGMAAAGGHPAPRSRPRVIALLAVSLAIISSLVAPAVARAASDESDVRGVVEHAFGQLRGGDYGSLYDVLPSASQKRVSRERFVAALERTRGMYELERIEIRSVHVARDLAVVDSDVYGRARGPFEGEGKIVLRQYLVREGGRWRVTTGELTTVRPLLAANSSFARKYPPAPPRLYVKREGRWIEVSVMRGRVRGGALRP